MTAASTLRLNGIGRRDMTRLTKKAKRLGITPERYLQELIEDDLALDDRARTTTLARIIGTGQPVVEAELDRLVDQARTRHHHRTNRKR